MDDSVVTYGDQLAHVAVEYVPLMVAVAIAFVGYSTAKRFLLKAAFVGGDGTGADWDADSDAYGDGWPYRDAYRGINPARTYVSDDGRVWDHYDPLHCGDPRADDRDLRSVLRSRLAASGSDLRSAAPSSVIEHYSDGALQWRKDGLGSDLRGEDW